MGERPSIFFEEKTETARPALIKRRPLGLEVVSNARIRDDLQAQRLRPPWGGHNLAVLPRIAETTLRLCVENWAAGIPPFIRVSRRLLCVSAPLRLCVKKWGPDLC
jgi:hypothetical protein